MQTDLLPNETTASGTSSTALDAPDAPLKTTLTLKVIGVGGAGGNAVSHMSQSGLAGVEFITINTDAKALELCTTPRKFCLGAKLTRGLGSGGDPARGRTAAEEDRDKLRAMCEGVDVLFVVAGLGGGTGTGASPVLAQVAKECGALVLGLVVLPFEWEGPRRQWQAQNGLRQLTAVADAVICLPNEKLFAQVSDRTGAMEGFAIAHEVLAEGVRGIWRLLTRPGLINVDFADVCTVARDRHVECVLATAAAEGESRLKETIEKLFKHPLMDEGRALNNSANILVSLAGGPELSHSDVRDVVEQIRRHCEDAHLITGAALEAEMAGRLTVMVLASPRGTKEISSPDSEPVADELVLEPQFVDPAADNHPPSRFVAPPPTITPDNVDQLLPNAPARMRKKVKMRQGTLNLETVRKGRFEKSEPTIRRGQDLDVPTYLRRNLAFN